MKCKARKYVSQENKLYPMWSAESLRKSKAFLVNPDKLTQAFRRSFSDKDADILMWVQHRRKRFFALPKDLWSFIHKIFVEFTEK